MLNINQESHRADSIDTLHTVKVGELDMIDNFLLIQKSFEKE